jgi:hypothetical protein
VEVRLESARIINQRPTRVNKFLPAAGARERFRMCRFFGLFGGRARRKLSLTFKDNSSSIRMLLAWKSSYNRLRGTSLALTRHPYKFTNRPSL